MESKIINLPNDIFWTSDFSTYTTNKINEYLKGRCMRSPGSPARRGWNCYPRIKGTVTEQIIFKLPDVIIDGNLSFKQNYQNNAKIFKKWAKENVNVN